MAMVKSIIAVITTLGCCPATGNGIPFNPLGFAKLGTAIPAGGPAAPGVLLTGAASEWLGLVIFTWENWD